MIEYTSKQNDYGHILVQVQDDLHQLKTKLLHANSSRNSQGAGANGTIDLTYLDDAITKTEKSIKARTEEALIHLNNRVTTVSDSAAQRQHDDEVLVETTVDMKYGTKSFWTSDNRDDQQLSVPVVKQQETSLVASKGMQMTGLSPGQALQHSLNARIIHNPYNARNREVVGNAYHVQLPLINSRKPSMPRSDGIVKGRTFSQLTVLPKANRADPSLVPPSFSEEDANHGITSLIDRGLIPAGSQVSIDPSPVRQKAAPIYCSREGSSHIGRRLDAVQDDVSRTRHKSATGARSVSSSTSLRSLHEAPLPGTFDKSQTVLPVRVLEIPSSSQPEPPPTTPASVGYEPRSYRFAIQRGKVRGKTDEFQAFKQQYYHSSWGSIISMIKHLEKLLTNYSIPVAFINGDRLAELALHYEMERVPTVSDLLSVIVNRDDVEALMQKPGRAFCGSKRYELAATKIQSTYRMYRERVKYVEYRRRKWAAGVFAISWIMCVKLAQVKRKLKESRQRQLESFRVRSKQFAENWPRLQTAKRTIVHIPSLGYSHNIRLSTAKFDIVQGLQMARLCDVKDSNVDVIYVSPVPVGDEMLQYYNRLLGLVPAVQSGNASDQSDLSSRFKIVTVEAAKAFQERHMCLSTLLKYSPRALKRVKSLLRGREAYIVTGVPHVDDIYISDYLGIPVLAPEPDTAHLYSTKSGAKRIFAAAQVTVPPGELDIYSLQQMHEVLAQLIVDNLLVTRWLFKIDHEYDGRGIAYLDLVNNLPCYAWCLKEAERYGPDKWRKKWAQEAAYLKLIGEIPAVLNKHAQPANHKAYSTWQIYLQSYLSQGGVIEACPPSDSTTCLSVSVLIEPGSGVKLVTSGDQIHAESQFCCWGLSTPQSSVDPSEINDPINRIADACRSRGIVGYITVDFVTFIDPITMKQELWATDLDVSYHDMVAMSSMTEFATNGQMESITHSFVIPPPVKQVEQKTRRYVQPQPERPLSVNRYSVFSTHLYHTNLSMVHYAVFFQMCRAHGIGYDIKEKQGTIFALVDATRREHLGMLTIGDSLQSVLKTFANNLSVMHQEISAPSMQGQSNFKAAIKDIESILGTTIENAEESENEKQNISST